MRRVSSVHAIGMVLVFLTSCIGVSLLSGVCALHDMRKKLNMRSDVIRYLYIILEVVVSLVPEPHTHNNDTYENNLFHIFYRNCIYNFLAYP